MALCKSTLKSASAPTTSSATWPIPTLRWVYALTSVVMQQHPLLHPHPHPLHHHLLLQHLHHRRQLIAMVMACLIIWISVPTLPLVRGLMQAAANSTATRTAWSIAWIV